MKYVVDKRLLKQLKKLTKAGGHYQKAALRIRALIGSINLDETEPLANLKRTNHGENRIKNCVKYDLNGFARLVTIQHEGLCTLIYAGDHEDCDKWLKEQRGLDLALNTKSKELVKVVISEDISLPETRQFEDSDFSDGKLFKKLNNEFFSIIKSQVSKESLEPFLEFETDSIDDEIFEACINISDEILQVVYFDVFCDLKKGDIDGAENRIRVYKNELKLIEDTTIKEREELISNDQFIDIQELETEYLKGILETKDWYDWMLFLHPAQKKVVERDFEGASRLIGVSGSGKTCVLVHRAVRLAKKYKGKTILILTLNPSLSKLIRKLVTILLESSNNSTLKKFIEVKSYEEVCKNILKELNISLTRERHFNPRVYKNRTSKELNEVWEEYYIDRRMNENGSYPSNSFS